MTHESTPNSDKKSLHYVSRTILAGGIAGCCAKTAIAPLERVKILFQGNNPKFGHHRGSIKGAFRVVHLIGSTEGPRALFRGNFATIVRIFPYAAIQYSAYEQFSLLFSKIGYEGKTRHFLSGACAGAVSVSITYPLDLIRARLAFQAGDAIKYKGLWHAICTRVQLEGGPRMLYSGFLPTFLGILPYAGTSFMTYGTLKNFFRTQYPWTLRPLKAGEKERELRTPVRLVCGGVAGAVGQTVAYPLDVVRRRMQVCGVLAEREFVYSRMIDSALYVIKTEGFRGLYMGLTINYVKVAPAVGISFVTYEYMKKLLAI